MSVILFYAPFDRRSRDTESLMIAFRKQGHRVIFLSQADGREIFEVLKTNGVECYKHVVKSGASWLFFLQHMWFFIRFCRKHRIDVVYSHLESANFVAAASQFFIHARVIICRHYIDELALRQVHRSLTYRLTYRWAKAVVVVSDLARRYMIEEEGVKPDKIVHIDLAYDFNLFEKPNAHTAESIRKDHAGELLLLMACRLTPTKRPGLAIDLLSKLREGGLDARLIVLGKGELLEELKAQAKTAQLSDRVHFAGLVRNVPDYLAASDILVHPSASESSCVIVKEAGLANKTVIVCRGVGDFDEYLVDMENAVVTDKDAFVSQAAALVGGQLRETGLRERLGASLGRAVRERFSIERMIDQYKLFNQPG